MHKQGNIFPGNSLEWNKNQGENNCQNGTGSLDRNSSTHYTWYTSQDTLQRCAWFDVQVSKTTHYRGVYHWCNVFGNRNRK